MSRLTDNQRLEAALVVMDEQTCNIYHDLVAYCEREAKAPSELTSDDLKEMLYDRLAELEEAAYRARHPAGWPES